MSLLWSSQVQSLVLSFICNLLDHLLLVVGLVVDEELVMASKGELSHMRVDSANATEAELSEGDDVDLLILLQMLWQLNFVLIELFSGLKVLQGFVVLLLSAVVQLASWRALVSPLRCHFTPSVERAPDPVSLSCRSILASCRRDSFLSGPSSSSLFRLGSLVVPVLLRCHDLGFFLVLEKLLLPDAEDLGVRLVLELV